MSERPSFSPAALGLKGMAMGIAEIIPGVSGGTIAFVTGIYERLLLCIKALLGPSSWRAFRSGGVRGFWQHIDGNFLATLFAGMALGLLVGVFAISHLLEKFPQMVWAFFFGLIIASSIVVARHVRRWGAREIAACIATLAMAYWYTVAGAAEGTTALWFVFISGVIAISALMLPGISGSFILVLMGMYAHIIGSLKTSISSLDPNSLLTMLVFATGCLIGLATFSRVLTWMFARFHDVTMAALTGFLLGSLNKIWPWRHVVSWRTDSHGSQVPVQEVSVWPWNFSGPAWLWACVGLMITGAVAVLLLERAGTRRDSAPDSAS